jgi:hypothetical protein
VSCRASTLVVRPKARHQSQPSGFATRDPTIPTLSRLNLVGGRDGTLVPISSSSFFLVASPALDEPARTQQTPCNAGFSTILVDGSVPLALNGADLIDFLDGVLRLAVPEQS